MQGSSARSTSAPSELTNSLEQQTAISEILRVISSSPTDVQPVLTAVAERAAHLCDAPYARMMLVEGDLLLPRPNSGSDRAGRLTYPCHSTGRPSRVAPPIDRKTIHIEDVVPLVDTEFPARGRTCSASAVVRCSPYR